MKPISSLKVALRALQTNKMRSFLTMLGIIIGVGAVIIMVAIGSGAREMIAAADCQHGLQSSNRGSWSHYGRRSPNGGRQRFYLEF